MSAIDLSVRQYLVSQDVLLRVLKTYGWDSNVMFETTSHEVVLNKSGYSDLEFAKPYFRAFGGAKFNVSASDKFWHIDNKGKVQTRCFPENIRITGYWSFCSDSSECKKVQTLFKKKLVRIGFCKRIPQDGIEHEGAAKISILFADQAQAIFELGEFQGHAYFSSFTSIGSFLALKCLAIRHLDLDAISSSWSIQEFELSNSRDVEKLLMGFGIV